MRKKSDPVAILKRDKFFRRFVGLAVTAFLFAAAPFLLYGQTSGTKAGLCAEKKAVLDKFEAAAPKIRELIKKAEEILKLLENPAYEHDSEAASRALEARKEEVLEVINYDLDSDAVGLTDEESKDESIELFDHKPPSETMNETKSSYVYIEVKKKALGLPKRRDYVANQIFLLRDSIKSLGCGGAVTQTNGTFDAAKYPFFKESKTWELSLTNESVTLGSGRTEKKIFRLKTVGDEYGSSIKATLSNAVPLSYIFGESWMGNADFNCDANFDGDILSFGCGEGSERDLFVGQFTVTVVDCVVPKLNGTLSYKGGYNKPAREWSMKGQLDWEPLRPSDCNGNQSSGNDGLTNVSFSGSYLNYRKQ